MSGWCTCAGECAGIVDPCCRRRCLAGFHASPTSLTCDRVTGAMAGAVEACAACDITLGTPSDMVASTAWEAGVATYSFQCMPGLYGPTTQVRGCWAANKRGSKMGRAAVRGCWAAAASRR